MCPACLTTLALITAGAGSAGGLTALVVRKLRGKIDAEDLDWKVRTETPDSKEKPR